MDEQELLWDFITRIVTSVRGGQVYPTDPKVVSFLLNKLAAAVRTAHADSLAKAAKRSPLGNLRNNQQRQQNTCLIIFKTTAVLHNNEVLKFIVREVTSETSYDELKDIIRRAINLDTALQRQVSALTAAVLISSATNQCNVNRFQRGFASLNEIKIACAEDWAYFIEELMEDYGVKEVPIGITVFS
ncbi:hypothetical protein DFH27DRAFT_581217 [Peziza echinospora]|nr:hypothetical protein DFH27DRAFT_581217 [Peziza echinospora]